MIKQWISVKTGLSRDPKHRRAMGELWYNPFNVVGKNRRNNFLNNACLMRLPA